MSITQISAKEARKIIVLSQLLAGPSVRQGVKRAILDTIIKIGYVQIDTISVIERAHHHKLWTRVKGYKKSVLETLEKERQVFEYWSHAASYLPMRNYRYTLPAKKEIEQKDRFWHKKDVREMRRMLDRIRNEGELRSRELEEKNKVSATGWPTWGPKKIALQHLFMEGKIMISRREGFQKVYDLTERCLPSDIDVAMPSRQEYMRFLVMRDLTAHGIMKQSEIGYLLKGIQKDLRSVVEGMIASGEVELITIGVRPDTFITLPGTLKLLEVKGYRHSVKLLSPFDNLIINRKRTLDQFGFNYTLECYVPSGKRQFGYFGLPILWKDRIVGQIDLKANRSTGEMTCRNIALAKRIGGKDLFRNSLQMELDRLCTFNGCDHIDFDHKGQRELIY